MALIFVLLLTAIIFKDIIKILNKNHLNTTPWFHFIFRLSNERYFGPL